MYKLIASLFILVAIYQQSPGQNTMTLAEAMDYAIDNHPDVRLANLNMTDADWQIKENRAVAYPQLNLNMNASHYLQQPS